MNEIIGSVQEIKQNYDILTSFTGVARINAITFIVYTDNFTELIRELNARKIATCWRGALPQRIGKRRYTRRRMLADSATNSSRH